jgi:hypothetical protein
MAGDTVKRKKLHNLLIERGYTYIEAAHLVYSSTFVNDKLNYALSEEKLLEMWPVKKGEVVVH